MDGRPPPSGLLSVPEIRSNLSLDPACTRSGSRAGGEKRIERGIPVMKSLSDRLAPSAGVVTESDASTLGRLWRPLLVAGFGIALLAGIGFAPAAAVHDAAHDGRHALTFPCH